MTLRFIIAIGFSCVLLIAPLLGAVDPEALKTIEKIETWTKSHPNYVLEIKTKSNQGKSTHQTFIKQDSKQKTSSVKWVMVTNVASPQGYTTVVFQSKEGDCYVYFPETKRLILQTRAYKIDAQIALLTGPTGKIDLERTYQSIKSSSHDGLEDVILVFDSSRFKTSQILPSTNESAAVQLSCEPDGRLVRVSQIVDEVTSTSNVEVVTVDAKSTQAKMDDELRSLPPLSEATDAISVDEAIKELLKARGSKS